jgi:hypothetical protein
MGQGSSIMSCKIAIPKWQIAMPLVIWRIRVVASELELGQCHSASSLVCSSVPSLQNEKHCPVFASAEYITPEFRIVRLMGM